LAQVLAEAAAWHMCSEPVFLFFLPALIFCFSALLCW
jgi:hypothetical protein